MALGRTTGWIAKILALVPLFGCGDAPRTQLLYASPHGSLAPLKFAAQAGRSVPVHVVNAPFDPDDIVSEQVAAILTKADRTLSLTAAGGGLPADTEALRILVLHDTPGGYSGISACKGKPFTPTQAGKNIEIRAIVCGPKGLLAEVLGILPRDTQDLRRAYDALLEQAVRGALVSEDRSPL